MTIRNPTLTAFGCALLGVLALGCAVHAAAYTRQAARATLEALDANEIQRRLDQELQWHRRTLTQAYGEVGRRDAKWNEGVRRGLDLAAQLYGVDPHRPGDVLERIPTLLGAAIAAGCDDPLVAYIHARIVDWTDRETAAVDELRSASTRLEQSQYPAFRRALALVYTADTMANLARTKVLSTAARDIVQRDALLDRATALLPEVFRDARSRRHRVATRPRYDRPAP